MPLGQCTGMLGFRKPANRTLIWLRSVIAFAALLATPVTLSSCDQPESVTLGFVGGLTGRVGALGRAGRDGALMAIEEANRQGGINGRPITLIVRDDQQDPEQLQKVLKELVDKNVTAFIGPMTSSMAVIAAPIITDVKKVMISPTTSTNALTGIDDYFMRVYPASALQAEQLARYVYENLGLRKMAVIYDTGNRAHTEHWFNTFKTDFEVLGGSVVSSETFESSDQVPFGPVAKSVLQSKPDGIFLLANGLDTALLSQALKREGYTGQLTASEWSATDEVLDLGAKAVTGLVFLQTFDRNSTSPDFLAFKQVFQARFNYAPGFAAVHAYDATRILIDTMAEHGTQDLRRNILNRSTFKGLQSPFSLDQTGDVRRKPFLMTIQDGRFVRLD